jgi:hypothetical protein
VICGIEKDIGQFEKTTNKSMRAECKQCHNKKRAERAKEAGAHIDLSKFPRPESCIECGKSYPDVEFQQRLENGTWRPSCYACMHAKGYSAAHRERARANDEKAYLLRNAAAHLEWAKRNPDKVKQQQMLTKTQSNRKFKGLVTYVKSKYGKDSLKDMIAFDDEQKLVAKMSEPCTYCGHAPKEGDVLNGIDRVDPKGKYEDVNTVPCCSICNAIKFTFPMDEFIVGVRNIVLCRGGLDNTLSNLPRPLAFGGTKERREKKKDKTNTLTDEQQLLLWSNPCYLCGCTPAFGIDREDSSKAYEMENCRSCCTLCNYMKKDLELDQFIGHVMRIYKHTKKWVLQDTTHFLSNSRGMRQPIAPVSDDGKPLLIFPSIHLASEIVGCSKAAISQAITKNKKVRGHEWIAIDVEKYNKQNVSAERAKAIIYKLQELQN